MWKSSKFGDPLQAVLGRVGRVYENNGMGVDLRWDVDHETICDGLEPRVFLEETQL